MHPSVAVALLSLSLSLGCGGPAASSRPAPVAPAAAPTAAAASAPAEAGQPIDLELAIPRWDDFGLSLTGVILVRAALRSPDGTLAGSSGTVEVSCARCLLGASVGPASERLALDDLRIVLRFTDGRGVVEGALVAGSHLRAALAGTAQLGVALADAEVDARVVLSRGAGLAAAYPALATELTRLATLDEQGSEIVSVRSGFAGRLQVGALAAAPKAAGTDEPGLPADVRFEDHIVETRPGERRVAAAFVEKVLANPMVVARGARVVPSLKDGKPDGFKLYAIRPDSIYAALGFENGDTIVAVNGMALTDPERALEVYGKVREARRIAVSVSRRGKPVELVFVIE